MSPNVLHQRAVNQRILPPLIHTYTKNLNNVMQLYEMAHMKDLNRVRIQAHIDISNIA